MRIGIQARSVFTEKIKGRTTETYSGVFTIHSSVQPAKNNEIQSLPEGRREREAYTLYSSDDLVSLKESKNPDQVLLYGDWYEVTSKQKWNNNIINHNKYVVTKL